MSIPGQFHPHISPIQKTVIAIAGPAVLELILTSLTQLVDILMVGKLGAGAIAAVGITNQPRFLMLAVFIALNVGTTALVARFRGQNNKTSADLVTAQSILLTILVGAVLSVIGVVFARDMVVLMGAETQITDAAASYFAILMMGFIPTALPLVISALLRGVGETKIALRYNVTANVVNVVFNYLLIYGKFGFPKLGVDGAAIATVIGNSTACLMALYAIAGERFHFVKNRSSDFIELRLNRKNLIPNSGMLMRILKIGLPSAAEQIALRTGLLMYTMAITALGTSIFAAHQIILTILNLSFVNGQAFGIASASLTGQALGRRDPEAARAVSSACQRTGAIISACMGIIMFIFRKELVGLFTTDKEIIALGASVMIWASIQQPFQASFQIHTGTLRGAGDSLAPAIIMATGILVIRPIFAYMGIYILGWGLAGAWIALMLDQTVRYCLVRRRVKSGKWLDISV